MTSKNLFFKRFKQDIEQRIWLPVLFFLVGFLVLELSLISRFDGWQGREDFLGRANRFLQNSFFSVDSDFAIVTIIVAVVCAISGFMYMHSAKKLDVYHSIPIKRQTLFLQQYSYGIIYYLVPMLLNVVLCLVLCMTNGVFSLEITGCALEFLWGNLLLFLASYSVTVLAVCLTGNLVVSVLGSAVLLAYSMLLSFLKEGLMSRFFTTFCYGDGTTDMGIPALTPLHLFIEMLGKMSNSTGEFAAWEYYVKFILMAVVYTALALFLYKKRPTEAAGQSIAFTITEPIIKTMVVFPVSIVAGYFFAGSISSTDDMGWFVFGCVFGFLFVCPLMEVIFRRDIKAVFSHPLQIVFNGVCVILTLVVFHFDVFGYDSYIPDEDKVASYAIDFGQLSTIYIGYDDAYTYRLDNMKIVDNESTRKLLEHAVEVTRPARMGELDEMAEAGELYYTYLDVRYNLQNGKSVYRSYLVNLKDAQVKQWIADTYNDIEHKLGAYPILAENRETDYIGVLLEYPFASEQLPLSEAKMEKLVETYRKELTNLKFEEMWTEYPVAKLAFAMAANEEERTEWTQVAIEDVYMEDSFEYYNEESGYKIYPSFTQTIALLEEYGADIVNEIPAEDVISISVEDYSEEVDDHDGLYDKIYVATYLSEAGQTEEIRQLIAAVIPNDFHGDFNVEEKVEPYIDVRIRYYIDDIEMIQNCSIKKGMLPGFVREDMKQAVE